VLRGQPQQLVIRYPAVIVLFLTRDWTQAAPRTPEPESGRNDPVGSVHHAVAIAVRGCRAVVL
jgi:hypothetical protein